jgi:hypothetical protein
MKAIFTIGYKMGYSKGGVLKIGPIAIAEIVAERKLEGSRVWQAKARGSLLLQHSKGIKLNLC